MDFIRNQRFLYHFHLLFPFALIFRAEYVTLVDFTVIGHRLMIINTPCSHADISIGGINNASFFSSQVLRDPINLLGRRRYFWRGIWKCDNIWRGRCLKNWYRCISIDNSSFRARSNFSTPSRTNSFLDTNIYFFIALFRWIESTQDLFISHTLKVLWKNYITLQSLSISVVLNPIFSSQGLFLSSLFSILLHYQNVDHRVMSSFLLSRQSVLSFFSGLENVGYSSSGVFM